VAMRGARWVAAGLVDQVVIAAANAGTTLLAVLVIHPDRRAGQLLLSLSLGYLVLGLNREFVGNVLLAQVSRLSGPDRDRMVRNALAAAFCVGCVAAVALLGLWAFWRHPVPKADLRDLVWLAPFLPAILVHDTGRYVYLSEREPARALRIDLVWVGTQVCAVVAGALLIGMVPGLLPASWGLGAVVGATVFLLRSRVAAWRGDPRHWLAETRKLSGWFTATGVIGQLHVQAIGFVVTGQLTPDKLAYLRTAQTTLLQPMQNFVTAMMGLLVPRSSRLAADGDAVGLRRQTVRVAAGFAGLAVLAFGVMVPLAFVAIRHVPQLSRIGPLIVPVSAQAGIYLVQIPFAAAIRGMHRGRLLFTQYAIFTTASLTGLVIGAGTGGLPGAGWGLAAGSAFGLALFVALYVWAVARLEPVDREAVPTEGVSEAAPAGT
jgi:O-antigen/teichoic acid export membrane protein